MLATEKFAGLRRQAYSPECVSGNYSPTDSKFSGIPWLAKGEAWPTCKHCEQPMQLFLQLDLNNLPPQYAGKFGDGLLQFFYCGTSEPHCEVECESWFYNDIAMLVRIVKPEGECGSPAESPVLNPFPPRTIKNWAALEPELPRVEELVALVDLSDEEQDALYDSEDDESFKGPASGDKLGGYPDWVQGPEYCECPECGAPTEHLFQIDSKCNLPYMWGDLGCGHITQCAEHKHILRFGWACS